tara:strand:- start:3531 stop:4817 length:1287 start_codon:yes stop_codon:yes gene_type:complete
MFNLFLFIVFIILNIYLVYGSSRIISLLIGLPINIAGSVYFSQIIFYQDFVGSNSVIILFLIFSFIFIFFGKKFFFPLLDKYLSNTNKITLKEIEYISYLLILGSFLAVFLNYSNLNFFSETRNYDLSKSGLKHIYTQFLILPKIASASGVLLLYFNLKNKKSIKLYLLSFLQILPVIIVTIMFGFRRSEIFHFLSPFFIYSVLIYAPNIIRNITKNKKRILSLLFSIFFLSGFAIDYTGPIRKYLFYCGTEGLCNLDNIRYYYIIDKERYRIPGETINVERIINRLNTNKIDYDFGTSTLNMLIFRFAPGILIGEDTRQKVRDNVTNRRGDLVPNTPVSGMGDSILSFGFFAPLKWLYSTLFFVPFFELIKKHSYFLLISLPPISSIIVHMFTHHLDLIAPDLITIFLVFKLINFSLNLFDKEIKKF